MKTVSQIAADHKLRLIGDGDGQIAGIASVESAEAQHLVFAQDATFLDAALKSAAGAVLAGEFAGETVSPKPILIARNPKLAFARIAQAFERGRELPVGVHPN